MADKSSPVAEKDSPEVAGAKEKIRMLEEKGKRLAAMDEKEQAKSGVDLRGAIDRNAAEITAAKKHLSEVSKK